MNKLNKSLSPIEILSLALGCIIGWGAFVMPATTFLPNAGPVGSAIAIMLAALVMIVIAFNCAFMINQFPVSGGAFKYTKEVFGAKHAFICAWFLGLSYLAIVPLNATALALISQNLFDNILQVGGSYTIAGYQIYLGELSVALLSIILFGIFNIKGVKFSSIIQTIIVFSLILSVILLLVASTVNQEANYKNLSPLFSPNMPTLNGILSIIAIAPWAFIGFDTIPQAAEEFKFSPTKAKLLLVLSILFGAFVYIALTLITVSIIPQGYTSWSDYILNLNSVSGLASLPTFYAAYNLMGNIGLFIITIAVLSAIFSGLMGFYMATSRLFYSMAKEGFLPSLMAQLHPKYKTPYYAILFIMLLSSVAPFFGRKVLLWIVDMSSIGAAIGFAYTSLAAYKVAKEKNNIFIILTGFVGTLFSLFFIYILLFPIGNLGGLSNESYISLFFWIILGIFFYYKRMRK